MKKYQRTKRLTAAFLACLLLFGAAGGTAWGEEETRADLRQLLTGTERFLQLSNLKRVAETLAVRCQTSRLTPVSPQEMQFTNLVEGYQLTVPKETRTDMSLAGVRSVLEWAGIRLEVYREDVFTASGFQEYLMTSRQFTLNQTDHTVQRQWGFRLGEHEAYLSSWHRRVLEKVVEDRNYYLSIDLLVEGEGVFTLLFQSASPLDETACIAIAASLQLAEPTRADYAVSFSPVWQTERWNEETAATYATYFGAESSFHWGIFDPLAPTSMEVLRKLEEELAYQFPLLMIYSNVKDSHNLLQLREELINAREHGRLPLLTLKTTAAASRQSNLVYQLLSGEYDSFLRAFAIEVKLAETPVLLRLEKELNLPANGYGAAQLSQDAELYKAMYRYIFDFFTKEGASAHVIWVFSPGESAAPNYKWNHEFLYYPGDDYVDVVGLTGFNPGVSYPGEQWRSFEDIFAPAYERTAAYLHKPLMITEVATNSAGGDKEAWVREMFAALENYPRISAALWWNHCDYDAAGAPRRTYWLDETEALKEIFRDGLRTSLNESR